MVNGSVSGGVAHGEYGGYYAELSHRNEGWEALGEEIFEEIARRGGNSASIACVGEDKKAEANAYGGRNYRQRIHELERGGEGYGEQAYGHSGHSTHSHIPQTAALLAYCRVLQNDN